MSETWIVNVGDREYGPFTDAQMAAFAAEGRLVPQSLVARGGENGFRPAGEDPILSGYFAAGSAATPEEEQPREDAGAAAIFGRNKAEASKDGERSHIVIIADMKSRSIQGLEEEIYKLGPAYPLLPQVWLLRTDQSVNSVRNLLVQQLGKLDVLFVVDATHNKAAWFNFGPEADTRIRRIWLRTQDTAQKARAAG